jgi:hypothetical protein
MFDESSGGRAFDIKPFIESKGLINVLFIKQ